MLKKNWMPTDAFQFPPFRALSHSGAEPDPASRIAAVSRARGWTALDVAERGTRLSLGVRRRRSSLCRQHFGLLLMFCCAGGAFDPPRQQRLHLHAALSDPAGSDRHCDRRMTPDAARHFWKRKIPYCQAIGSCISILFCGSRQDLTE
jgi:hypothetical protein